MNGISLTVCIPTYNRPDHIKRQVRNLLPQLDSETALVVLDNHSDVPVNSLFAKEELEKFEIIRHNSNIGGDANNARCLEIVTQGWLWLLGDDDQISPDALMIQKNLINKHQDCCYINMGCKKEKLVQSYREYLDYFKIKGSFGNAFFQSACLFNMTLLHSHIYWIYNYLSTQIGQFCIVMKYMESNQNAKCFFSEDSVIVDKEYGTWSRTDFIINSSLFVDKNKYNKKNLKSNVFAALATYYLDTISYSQMSLLAKTTWMKFVFNRFGFYNVLRYSYISFMFLIVNLILPKSICVSLHKGLSKRYNKKLKESR